MTNRRRHTADFPLAVVVDFDGIIVEAAYPAIGKTDWFVVGCLKRLRGRGAFVILNTCRWGQDLIDATNHCADIGLRFDAVNENLDHLVARWGDPRKLGGDIYIDDRDICFSRNRLRWRLLLLTVFFPWVAPRYRQ